MNSLLSRQTLTNSLLVTLVILNLVALFILTNTLGKMQKSLNWIDGHTSEMDSSLNQIKEDTKYIQISTEATVNALER